MKILATAAAAIALFAASASAGDLSVSGATLANMGLGGMQQLSDVEGQSIRGQGLGDDFLAATFLHLDGLINGAINEAGAGGSVAPVNLGGIVLGTLGGIGGGGGGFPTGGSFNGFGGSLGNFGGGLGGMFNF
jgi:hypothetical protein